MSNITTPLCENCGAALLVKASLCSFCAQTIQTPFSALPTQQRPFAPGVVIAGRYRIEAKIGEGGFGVVYKAIDTAEQNRLVALKQITLSALNAQEQIEATASYNREVTLAASLRHKHLATLYDHFTDAENWYLVLEYIDGQTLEETLAQEPDGCLLIGEVIAIGQALCDVLGYLHLQDPPIIFRDVKPANVMRAKDGQIYLIDFGIARHYQIGQNKDTGPLGSPGYAAPEQYGRAQTDRRTDIYGLGATLQTLLTGKDPLEIRAQGLPPDCEIPAELHTLILRMLDQDPVQRPSFMLSVSTVLKKLQKRYPRMVPRKSPVPFAWLAPLWVLFIQIVGMFLFRLPLEAYLILSLLVVVISGGVQVYRQYQRRSQRTRKRSTIQKPTWKGMQNTLKEILTVSAGWISYPFIYSIFNPLRSLFDHFQLSLFLAMLVYLIAGIGGLFTIDKYRQSFQKAATTSAPPQDQPQAQPLLMYQSIPRRKP